MLNYSNDCPLRRRSYLPNPRIRPAHWLLLALPVALLLFAVGCQTQNGSQSKTDKADMAAMSEAAQYSSTNSAVTNSDLLVLHEGDTLAITFPGAPDLNT